MDLRPYEVPDSISDAIQAVSDGGPKWYQPFIFNQKVITGTGPMWNAGVDANTLFCTEKDAFHLQNVFLREALSLGSYYHGLVDMVEAILGDKFKDASFLDVGCNVGHFCFDLVQRGATEVTGVDVMPQSYDIVREITSLKFNYLSRLYSERTHRVDGVEPADVSFAIAISTHLCDPHYFLAWLAENTRKMMLVVTPVAQAEGSQFMARQPNWRTDRALPHCYELVPTPTLLQNMLRFSGFTHVYRLEPNDRWPANIKKYWGGYLVSKEADLVTDDILERFNLTEMPDLRDESADVVVAGRHSRPKSWNL